jgi:hypothetical protein
MSPGDPFAVITDLSLLHIGRGAEALFLSCLNRRYGAEPYKPRRDPIRRRQAQSHKDLPDLCSTVLRRHLRSCFLPVKSRAQVTALKECWRKEAYPILPPPMQANSCPTAAFRQKYADSGRVYLSTAPVVCRRLNMRRGAGDSQERELRLSGILTTASPDIFKQSTLLSTTGRLCERLAGDGHV